MCNLSRPNRFTKQDRLLTAQDFKAVFANPVKSADARYTILAIHNHHTRARLGVIVSKKNVPTAAARNRLKRIVRESFRTHKHLIKNLDVVVICKPRSATTINQVLFEKLHKHWMCLNAHAE